MKLIKRLTALLCAAAAAVSCAVSASAAGAQVKFTTVFKPKYETVSYCYRAGRVLYGGYIIKGGKTASDGSVTTDTVIAFDKNGKKRTVDLGQKRRLAAMNMSHDNGVLYDEDDRLAVCPSGKTLSGVTLTEKWSATFNRGYFANDTAFRVWERASAGAVTYYAYYSGRKLFTETADGGELLSGYFEHNGNILVYVMSADVTELRTPKGSVLRTFEGAVAAAVDHDAQGYIVRYPYWTPHESDNLNDAEYYNANGTPVSKEALSLEIADESGKSDRENAVYFDYTGASDRNPSLINRKTGRTVAASAGVVAWRMADGKAFVCTEKGGKYYAEVYNARTGKLIGKKALGECSIGGTFGSEKYIYMYYFKNNKATMIKVAV